jgi:hypothetical protein
MRFKNALLSERTEPLSCIPTCGDLAERSDDGGWLSITIAESGKQQETMTMSEAQAI